MDQPFGQAGLNIDASYYNRLDNLIRDNSEIERLCGKIKDISDIRKILREMLIPD